MLGRFMVLALAVLLLAGSAGASSYAVTAFQNGKVVRLVYFDNFTCFPNSTVVYMNSSESINASAITVCEYGSSAGVNTTGSIPRWDLIPAFAGLSVYGYIDYGSTPQGYSTYKGQAVTTECGAGQTPNACIHRPANLYSPIISAIERGINISNGINGLPEGVLPNAAHNILVSSKKNGTVSRSYEIRVWVLDPNIFPNLKTGKCTQLAPSSLANATSHCLTSEAALEAAISTNDTAVPAINANNILWKVAGMPKTQAVILTAIPLPGNSTNPQFAVQQSDDINISNTNLFIWSYIGNANLTTVPTTTIAQAQQYPAASTLTPAALLIVAVLAAWYLARRRLWGVKKGAMHGAKKAQGAMEYLMTYGWAILIVAIVLGALFRMGVFNTSFAANSCTAASGYFCAGPSLAQNDNISFTVGQLALTKTIYNVAAACSSSATGVGLPNPSPASGGPYAAMVYLSSTGAATNVVANGVTAAGSPLSLFPGQKVVVTGLTCYGTTVGPTMTPGIDTAFNGYIWLDYTTGPSAPTGPGGGNPLNNVKIAAVSVKVSH
jgi:hypothetical protein